ncbi:acetylcholinesterase-1-like [Argiope bruennichi]|uniref:acetylcholinesterase-1-like n=1 Tax=Argiope bruennichi TaxID=94029 RepID=UPI00249599F6|nr:acetylcholinesterase-1-like [Argiope bruennichi]XP_055952492.1 acetylcholinesterase-1-like [Argiope bruennichi]
MIGHRVVLFVLCNFIATVVVADRVVMTNNGPVQGITVAKGDLDIEAFLGIPYAEPPVGRLRFLKPVPKTSWNGVFDASKIPPTCVQNVTFNYYFEPNVENMTEDCLYLNLWVPYLKKSSKLKPVIVFIHGGAFNVGSSNLKVYDGTKLAQFGDVIVASMNYRLGSLGFFTAFIDEANGNAGILDQVLAIKWIWENAKSFGGDPNHVVLMGESAGAMTISGHLISPMVKHMVKRAIMQSGAATLPFLLDDNAQLYTVAQRFATLAGCADKKLTIKDDPSLVVQCLKRLPAERLAAVEGLMKSTNPITFYPRVGDEFLPIPTIHELKEGNFKDVELLIGNNKEEGPFFVTVAAPQYFGTYGVNGATGISRRFAHQLIRIMFGYLGQKKEKEIADFYINTVENGTSETYTPAIATALGDFLINCADVFQAEIYSMRNPVYFYKFSRRASASYLAEWMDTTHFDELQFVFGNPVFGNFTPEEEEFSRHVMARWIAFVKTGDPNVPGAIRWPTFKQDDPEYLEIDKEEAVRLRPDNYRCEFWRDRYDADINESVYAKVRRSIVESGGSQATTNIFLKFAALLLVFLQMIIGVI